MAMKVIHSWTLAGLMLAFVDLAVAYCLLCVSAFAFVTSKILSFFDFPCPCSGFFGYKNSNLCFHELLIDWPTSKISHVMELVSCRFPFDLIWLRDQSFNSYRDGVSGRICENEIFELEGEACSGSFPGAGLENRADGHSKYDAKGKKIMNQKQKTGIRRRKRDALGYGKFSSALSSKSRRSVVIGVLRPPYDCSDIRSETSESPDPISGIEYGPPDDGNAPNGGDFADRTWSGFELSGSYGKSKGVNKDLSSVGNFTCNAGNSPTTVGNDANAITMLEQALKGERAARAALYQELEKERAAAASAADEAMAMIFRLQEEKASIEMEVRQYQRMIDEKFAYDEDEMNILKEILVRRERENHFLEKELEGYRQVDSPGKEKLEGDLCSEINSFGQRPSVSVDSSDGIPPLMQYIEKIKFIDGKEVAKTTNLASNAFGRGTTSGHKELTSDLSPSHGPLQEKVTLAQINTSARDVSMISQGMMAPQTQGVNGEVQRKDKGHCNQGVHCSFLDTEPIVYDVHVVDDKPIAWKEDDGKEGGPLSSGDLDFGICSGNDLSDCPSTSMTEVDPNFHLSCLDTSSQLPVLGNPHSKTLSMDARWTSSPAVNKERLKIDTEVEWLRERLRIVQEGKEKLAFSAEHQEKVNGQVKLLEEIVNQLREIQLLREPLRQASLPTSFSKVSLKKRCSRSVSGETFDSA